MSVRVRFAPSPTGFLHVGNIRIAIINYIYARQTDGAFLLRIDDTDKSRSTKEYEMALYEDLKWLGLPNIAAAHQSDNITKYNAAFEILKKTGHVYPCFETPEELNLARKLQLMQRKPPVYNRAALNLSPETIEKNIREGKRPYWRFKLTEESSSWNELICGSNLISLASISDPVVVKPDGSYVYTFASVVDDINMGISHIIRGADHVTNTAAQIAIFKALGADLPTFGHLPLLSSAEGGDISKRAGSAYSIKQLREGGAEPFAVIAALASLGSSYNYKIGDTIDTVINNVDLHKLSLSAPKFSIDNILQISKKVINHYEFNDIVSRLSCLLNENDTEWLSKFWYCIRGNLSKLTEAKEWYHICRSNDIFTETSRVGLGQVLRNSLTEGVTWDKFINDVKLATNLSVAELMHEIRLIMTGKPSGPDLRSLFDVLGYDILSEKFSKLK